jgi:hypothetical protein
MMERRSVLKLGAASVAGALISDRINAFGAMPAGSRGVIGRAVFDERFEECLAFAGEMKRMGIAISAVRGDVSGLWYEDLQACLREDRAPIAGLTDRITLFCLEELVRDVGMKVFFRVDHLIDASGLVQHEAMGPPSVVAATRMLAAESGFGQAMAVLACRCEMNGPREIAAQKRTGPFSPENKSVLVSWLIT